MPDCLTTTRSESPDIAILRTASEIAHAANSRPDIPADVARHMAVWADDLKNHAGDVRALAHQPSKLAGDLIHCFRKAVSLADAIWSSRTTLRCLPTDDQARVAVEVVIIRAERERARQGEMAR